MFWVPISSIIVKDYISSTHDTPNKVWLDVYVYPGIFNGSLLESYEVVIKNNKVESYRKDYPDAQTGFTGMRCRSNS